MNKRCIVNVATGEFYCKQQARLMRSFENSCDFTTRKFPDTPFNKYSNEPKLRSEPQKLKPNPSGIDLLLFRDDLPTGSRPHSQSQYGFKIHAIKAALEMGYTTILWLDSPAYAVKQDISPIFEKIEKEGYYAMSHTDPLKNWVSDYVLDIFNTKREKVNTNLPSGSCYGFYFPNGHNRIFTELVEAEKMDYFSLAYNDDSSVHHCRREVHRPFNSKNHFREITGWHRHDEACLGMILLMFGLPTFHYDPLFQSDDPRCVIKSGG